MTAFVLFASVFLLFGWFIYRMLRYTNESVGEASPIKTTVVYQYGASDFLQWTNTPLWIFLCLISVWASWIVLSYLDTATSIWHYVLAISIIAVCVALFYLLNKLFLLEEQFWTIIRHTALVLDPTTKSITVHRAGTSTVLNADTVAQIESHITAQGKFAYFYFCFIDHDGNATFFFDYGKGLGFAIEAYFKGVPMKWIEHKFPFKTVSVS